MNTPKHDFSCYSTTSTPDTQPSKENSEYFLVFKEYILQNHVPDIVQVLLEEEINVHYCLKVDGSDLLENCVALSEYLFFQPERILKLFDKVFHAATCVVYSSHHLKEHMTLKPFLHIRLSKLPSCPEIWRDRVPKSIDIGRFLALEGTVIRTSSAKILEYKKEYMCSKCKNVFSLQADFQLHYTVPTPTSCPVHSECSGKKFIVVAEHDGTTGPKKCKDYQEIRVQEQVRKLSMGTIPRSLTIVFEDDLVDSCKPGDDVVIFGSVACRWHPSTVGKPCDLELVLKANNVEVCNERHSSAKGIAFDELQDEFECFWASHGESSMMKARNHILASLCPQVYGLYVVKLAVALVLAGGVPRTDASGSRVRGECHLLLVGDPGTGKSQFLKYAAKVTPRSVLTTGIGSSTAGLTVTAIRDGPHWTLEAGALVLADGGICCIDEFSGIKEHDRSAIHEAMEQQSISIAKAGLVCKLNTRTSILAATNPKLGKYDEMSSVSFNIAMASPLLSRFDLVLVLLDVKNLHWDSVIADYLLLGKDAPEHENSTATNLWNLEQMQAYFGMIRQLNPSLSSEADQVLRAYYRCHRQSNSRNAARTTIRLLESLIRLSEAHARLMFRNVVTIQDAIAAVTVMESSMQGGSLLPTGSILHSCFPKDADLEYKKHSRLVLQCLSLEHFLESKPSLPTQNPSQCSSTAPQASQVVKTALKPHLSKDGDASQTHSSQYDKNKGSLCNVDSVNFQRTLPSFSNQPTYLLKSSSKKDDDINKKSFAKSSHSVQQSQNIQRVATTKRSQADKENTFGIFRLDSDETETVFNVESNRNEQPNKKRKMFKFCPDSKRNLDFELNDTFSQTVPSAITHSSNTPLDFPLKFTTQSHDPIPSQESLFSLSALNSPKTTTQNLHSKPAQRKCQLFFNRNRSPSSPTKKCSNDFSFFSNSPKQENRNNTFQLPESETVSMFSGKDFDFSFSDKTAASKTSSTVSTSFVSCTSNAKRNSFCFTLDPSMIEDMCSDLDF